MAAIDTETNGAAIKAAWDSLKDAGDFVVLELNGNTLQIKAQGNNGLEGVKGNLDNSKILWGAFNVTAVDELSGVITKSQNRITFTFMGSDIGAVKKSQITQQKGTIKDKLFPGNSATFDIDDRADLDPKEVAAKLCAKAHRPKYFDFGAGVKEPPSGFNLSALGSSSFSTPPAETPDSPPRFNNSSSFSLPSDNPKISLSTSNSHHHQAMYQDSPPNVNLTPPPAPPPSPPPPAITIVPPSSPPRNNFLSSMGSSSFSIGSASTPQNKPPPPITSSSSFSNPSNGLPIDCSPSRQEEQNYQEPHHVFPSPPPPPPPSPSLVLADPSQAPSPFPGEV